jgi:hypothetical protein
MESITANPTVGDDAARRLRLRAQGLLRPVGEEHPEALVAAQIGIQGQDMPGAELALWARGTGLHAQDLSQAISDRRVVRTWAMRGTLHLLVGSDVRLVLAALSPALTKPSARHAALGLDSDTFVRAAPVLRDVLQGGQQRTRAELGEALRAHGIAPDGQRLPHILAYLSLRGVLCQGTPQGREPTYVLLDEWLPAEEPVERTVAMSRLVRRYITAYGPANSQDFAGWSGLSLDDARLAWRLIEPETTTVVVRNTHYAVLGPERNVPAPFDERSTCVRLLPGFDNYLLGYSDRRLNLDPAYVKRVNAGGGMPKPTVVVDGRVVGIWSRAVRRRRLSVNVTLFEPLTGEAADALGAEVRRLSRFLGLETDLTVTGPE